MIGEREQRALRDIVAAIGRGELPRRVVLDGQAISIRVRAVEPTPCEVDLLKIVSECQPITTSRIIEELDRRDLLHGDATVRKALARMVKDGRLVSSKMAPRGYRLPNIDGIYLPDDV